MLDKTLAQKIIGIHNSVVATILMQLKNMNELLY